MKDIVASITLLKAVRDLEVSLQKSYDTKPENPETDFLIAAGNVAFFSKIVFKDLVARQGEEISASWATSLAIALGEFEEACSFIDRDVLQAKQEGVDLNIIRENIEMSLRNHGRSPRWRELLSRIR